MERSACFSLNVMIFDCWLETLYTLAWHSYLNYNNSNFIQQPLNSIQNHSFHKWCFFYRNKFYLGSIFSSIVQCAVIQLYIFKKKDWQHSWGFQKIHRHPSTIHLYIYFCKSGKVTFVFLIVMPPNPEYKPWAYRHF